MAKKNVKNIMLEHSKAKVELYDKYLKKYLNIIGHNRHVEAINLFDLFCGPGIYDDGGKGSPIAALETIKNWYFANNKPAKPKINVLFNDMNAKRIDELQKHVVEQKIHIPPNCHVRYNSEDYEQIIKNVKNEIDSYRNEKAVVFIDPYGYKSVKINDLKQLLNGEKTEVLLFLPVSFMYRFVSKVSTLPKQIHKKDENILTLFDTTEYDLPKAKMNNDASFEPLKQLMHSLFGKDFPTFKSIDDFIEQLEHQFKQRVGSFTDTFMLQRDNANYFCLFFFTSHIYGLEKMLETKWAIDKEEGTGFYLEKTANIFSKVEVSGYDKKLETYLKAEKRYNSDIYEFSLKHKFLPTHTNDLLREWQKDNKLQVYINDTTMARKGAFYVNYDTFKHEKQKVFFKIVPQKLELI